MSAPINIDIPKIILDNGGGLIKGGILPSYSQIDDTLFEDIEPKFIVPNCVGQIRKKNIFHISDSCYSICEYFCHRPHVDGLLLDLEMQTKIWEKIFACKQTVGNKINDMAICVTESYLTPAYIRQGVIELLFEYFNFEQIVIVSSQTMLPFSFIGLNLGQYDILNPPVFNNDSFLIKKNYFTKKKRKGEKGKMNLKKQSNSKNSIKENISYSNSLKSTREKNIDEDMEVELSDMNKKVQNGENDDNFYERDKSIKNVEEGYDDTNVLTNKHIFIKNIECYNKYTYKIYMSKMYHGENWQEYYFNSFFNLNYDNNNPYADLNNTESDYFFNSNNIVSTLYNNNYIGNNFLNQDPNFLLPEKIDLCKSYYDKNFKDINTFKEHYNSSYINNFYSNILNGNYNLSLRNPCALYIDVGYSHTYILPYIEYKLIEYAILRTKVSASILNTYLKNTLSYKHINLEHNELLVENIKERACYVSLDYVKDLENEKKRLEEIKKQKIKDKLNMRNEMLIREIDQEKNNNVKNIDKGEQKTKCFEYLNEDNNNNDLKKEDNMNYIKNNNKVLMSYENENSNTVNNKSYDMYEKLQKKKNNKNNDLIDQSDNILNVKDNNGSTYENCFSINNNFNKSFNQDSNEKLRDEEKRKCVDIFNLKNENKEIFDENEENEKEKHKKIRKSKKVEPHLSYKYKLIDYNNATKHEINEVFDTLKKNCTNDCIHLESDYDYKQEFSNFKEDESIINEFNVKGSKKKEDVINLTNERIGIPEVLFNPQDINLEHCSIVELIYRCISLLPKEIQKYFVSQIYISGGSTKFKNFKHRLYKELRAIFPTEWEINIYSHKNSLYSNYIGTYVWLSDQNIYNYNVITKEQYFNHGKKT
ncbi:actin-related protein, putative [Plasmodium gallinaceum]|uniref:Actin-related protein, putative n=1 Tax=Plasmodium gallinaceum TaxID=5849 RepID=A0A1J1GL87_PLAGA|nr:actin-related protein, putative [Plasmodium gallinaceum]CRG93121.1 actin-related protein, putative [Plasmodium gallinaceum]